MNFDPAFWIDHQTGNHYFLGVQYPEERIRSLETLKNIPITSPVQKTPVLLKNIATIRRSTTVSEVNHVNITRVTDVYVNVEGRDVGSVAADIERLLADIEVPAGYAINMRGEVSTMRESFGSLGFGLLLAALLVYLVMVVQFQSFRDPLVVLFAVPLGFIGVPFVDRGDPVLLKLNAFPWILLATGTALSSASAALERSGFPGRRARWPCRGFPPLLSSATWHSRSTGTKTYLTSDAPGTAWPR